MPQSDGSKSGGRKKGTPNKLALSVKEGVLEAYEQLGGVDYLVGIGRDDPRTFAALMAKLIPSEVKADVEVTGLPKVIIRSYTKKEDADSV